MNESSLTNFEVGQTFEVTRDGVIETTAKEEVNNEIVNAGPTEAEKAGASFAGTLNYFKKLTTRKGMSAKKLARVLIAVAEFPLAKNGPRLLDQEERVLFQMFHNIQTNKNAFLEELMKEKKLSADSTSQEVAAALDTPAANAGETQVETNTTV